MEQERIILKKLREQNKLSLDEAAKLIGRSKGWLSEIENNKGRSVLRPQGYKRIYDLYHGDQSPKYLEKVSEAFRTCLFPSMLTKKTAILS